MICVSGFIGSYLVPVGWSLQGTSGAKEVLAKVLLVSIPDLVAIEWLKPDDFENACSELLGGKLHWGHVHLYGWF